MSELRVTQWQRFGHDRWYVGLPDGTAVGWLDRPTGRITITDARYGHAALNALEQTLRDYQLPATRPPDEASSGPRPGVAPVDAPAAATGPPVTAALAAAGPGPGSGPGGGSGSARGASVAVGLSGSEQSGAGDATRTTGRLAPDSRWWSTATQRRGPLARDAEPDTSAGRPDDGANPFTTPGATLTKSSSPQGTSGFVAAVPHPAPASAPASAPAPEPPRPSVPPPAPDASATAVTPGSTQSQATPGTGTTLTKPPAPTVPTHRAPLGEPAAPHCEPEPDSGNAPTARPGAATTSPGAGTGPATRPTTVPPEFDLAPNRPGGQIRAQLDQVRQERSERLGSRLQRRSEREKSWRVDLAGEKRVGSELHRLKRHGWYVLHSIPLSGTEDIDHLLIGPGGVFAIATRHHPGQAVRVDDDTVRIGSGAAQAHHLADDTEAAGVREAIAPHCEFTIQVQRVVVYVGVTELTVEATRLPARLYQERQVSALGPLTGALTPAQVAHVHRVARDRRTWSAAL